MGLYRNVFSAPKQHLSHLLEVKISKLASKPNRFMPTDGHFPLNGCIMIIPKLMKDCLPIFEAKMFDRTTK